MAGRKAGQGSNWIRKDKRWAIYMRDGCACIYCEVGADQMEGPMTLDHLLACELGGQNTAANLVTCCVSCNSSKRDLTMGDWMATLRDCGVDTRAMAAKIRKHTARKLDRKSAKAMLADR